jgi:hypothetical protein
LVVKLNPAMEGIASADEEGVEVSGDCLAEQTLLSSENREF